MWPRHRRLHAPGHRCELRAGHLARYPNSDDDGADHISDPDRSPVRHRVTHTDPDSIHVVGPDRTRIADPRVDPRVADPRAVDPVGTRVAGPLVGRPDRNRDGVSGALRQGDRRVHPWKIIDPNGRWCIPRRVRADGGMRPGRGCAAADRMCRLR
jgi:hypothetical protein